MSSPASDVVTKSQFIRAGAGAGKTTRLIEVFMEFTRQFHKEHKRYPKVVLTTFTRKATQEVKERMLVSALKANETEIFNYINKKSNVHISTIHGLLSLFLSQYCYVLKLPQEIRIIDGSRYLKTLKKTINKVIKKNSQYYNLLESYSFNQLVDITKKAIDYKSQYGDELKYVSAKLLEKKSDVIKKQIAEIAADLAHELSAFEDIKVINYTSYLKNIKKSLDENNEDLFFALIDDAPDKPRKSKKNNFSESAEAMFDELKELLTADSFDSESYITKHEELNELYFSFLNQVSTELESLKQLTGEMTINDLETQSLKILKNYPQIAKKFSNSWDYFMIDEYQDTSPLQVEILNLIVQNRPCFIVGDPQQSIYLFRGARSEVFELKQDEMLAKKADIHFLDKNYRTQPYLMSYINSFFDKFSQQFSPMALKEVASDFKRPVEYDVFYVTTKNQAQATLHQIKDLINKGVSPQDICVLSRNNRKLTLIAEIADQNGISVKQQSSAGFESKREILDLISFNRFLNNPYNNENLVELLRSPWFFVSDEILIDWCQQSSKAGQSLWTWLKLESKVGLNNYLEQYNQLGVLQTTINFLEQKKVCYYSNYYDATGTREANILKYLAQLAEASKNVGFMLGEFLEDQFQSLQSSDLAASNSEAQPVVQPNSVSLMTVHASKGLQFKHVIVIGFADEPSLTLSSKLMFDEDSKMFSLSVLNDETSKHQESSWAYDIKKLFNLREMAENERVLYVACTRAIDSLTFIADLSSKRKPTERTWYKRVSWPEAGTYTKETTKVIAYEHQHQEHELDKVESTAVAVRPKFTELISEAKANSTSVTETLSQDMKTGVKIDYSHTLKHLYKAQKGTDLHRIFESLKYVTKDKIFQVVDDDVKKMIQFLYEQKKINFDEILKNGHNEWGFGLQTNKRFIQGQIDLWADFDQEIHILDYKTGSQRYLEKAFDQLKVYALALHSMGLAVKDKKIVLSVVYPVDEVVEVKNFANIEEMKKQTSKEILELF